ncbi:MAG: 23S rRNA (guanosine(2251)-2'-O)-methyltransferase RlmB [Spirochaetes bacterium]|nr:23S rRNA (guanosine(2251)-2'-O)-methyltransferase RlmB [Spirochaetota bacterium]
MEIITGFHAIEETIKNLALPSSGSCKLYITGKHKRHDILAAIASEKKVEVIKTDQKEIDSLTDDDDNRGALFILHTRKRRGVKHQSLKSFLDQLAEAPDKNNSIVLLLDGITDPHNFGAILRSADQFGVDLVIIPGNRSAGENATVRKTSAGASEYVSVVDDNLARSIDALKKSGFWVYGADMKGQPCMSQDLRGRIALILGSEGKGISRLLAEKCDGLVKIPSLGRIDSLNVSVACGILLYEIIRQQTG